MIANTDRSGWIGASDVEFVIGNWKTRTWEKWWLKKLGIDNSHVDTVYTRAGNAFEHRVLDSLCIPNLIHDRQILLEDILLRVNLDGDDGVTDYECKTYKLANGWKLPGKYIHQVQVQLYASRLFGAQVVSYGLKQEDYDNFLRDIDPCRLKREEVAYDRAWVERVYLPKHMILCDCLKRGAFPNV